MTRCDRYTWTELLDSNWSGWPNKVLDRVDSPYPRLYFPSTSSEVYYIYEEAINIATMEELIQLDSIYCQEVLLRGM